MTSELVPAVDGVVVGPRPGRTVRDVAAADWDAADALAEAVYYWLASKKSPHTREAYSRNIARWFGWCAATGAPVADARRADVDEWRNRLLAGGLAPASVAQLLAAVSSFYDYWLSEDVVRRNPARRAARPEVSAESRSIVLTAGQASQLLGYVDSLPGLRAGVIVRLLAETGMRIAELSGARAEHLAMSDGHHTITVVRKGGKTQALPIAQTTYGRVLAYLDGRRSGLLIQTWRGERKTPDGRVSRSYVRDMLRRVTREAGLPDEVWQHMHPHVLRGSVATIAAADNVPVPEIQRLLGHQDMRTTQRYIHASEDLTRSPVYRVAALIAPRPVP